MSRGRVVVFHGIQGAQHLAICKSMVMMVMMMGRELTITGRAA